MRRGISLAPFAVYVLVICLAWLFIPAGGFWVNDEALKHLQVAAINSSPSHDLAIHFPCPTPAGLPPPLPDWVFWQFRGSSYVLYPEFFARLLALVARSAGETGMRLVPLVAGILAVAAWSRSFAWLRPRAASLLPLLVLASPVAFYHWLVWEHTLAFLVQAISLWIFFKGCRERPALLLVSGVILGIGTFLRMELAIYATAFIVAQVVVTRELRRPIVFGIGFALPVLALLTLNTLEWGLPLGPHFLNVQTASASSSFSRLAVIRALLIGNSEAPIAAVASSVAFVSCLAAARLRGPWSTSIAGLSLVTAVLARIFLPASSDTLRALLDYGSLAMLSPALLVGLAPHPLRSRRPAELRVLAATAWIFILAMLLACPRAASVGIHWGPRLMLPLLLPLAILAADHLETLRRRARLFPAARPALGIAIVALSIGFFDSAESFVILRWQKLHSQSVEQTLLAAPEHYIVTDKYWMSEIYTRLHTTRCVLVARTSDDWKLAQNAIRQVGAPSFILATSEQLPDSPTIQRLPIENRKNLLDVNFYRITSSHD